MKTILSTDSMGISRTSIKKLVNNSSKVRMSSSAVESIVKLLEAKARRIAKYAVKRAKMHNRSVVTEEDVDTYRIRFGD